MKIFTDVKEIIRKKDKNYYKNLYSLQDKVLEEIFNNCNCKFYLTGGTALNRFHQLHFRFSDDIDLFFNTENNKLFNTEKEIILEKLSKIFDIRNEIDLIGSYGFLTKSNSVYYLYSEDIRLKIQFVQDLRKMTNSNLLTINNIKIDNIENILTNKIAAFYHRESLKDFIDLVGINYKLKNNIDWSSQIHNTKINKLHNITYQTFINKFLEKLTLLKDNDKYYLKNENIKLTEKISIKEIIEKAEFIFKNLLFLYNKKVDILKSNPIYYKFVDEVNKQQPENPDEALKWMDENEPYSDEKFEKWLEENYTDEEIKEVVKEQQAKGQNNNNQQIVNGSRPNP